MFWLILGGLIILYCLVVRIRLGRVRFAAIASAGGLAMILLGGLILLFPYWLPVWILQLLAVTGLVILCGAELMVFAGSLSGKAGAASKQPVQYTVVLGSGLKKGSQMTSTLIERLSLAEKLYQGEYVILSGGQTRHETAVEADVMAQWLLKREKIPAQHLLLERGSVNTRQNLCNTHRMLGNQSLPAGQVRIVTSDFHCWRTARLAAACGLSGAMVCGSRTMALIAPLYHLRETLAIVYGVLRRDDAQKNTRGEKEQG